MAREFIQLAVRGAKEMSEHPADQLNLKRILDRRSDQAQLYFNQVAGRFDRSYGPGRSWQAFGHLLLRILPQITVADLGAGEGLLSELLARRCKKVIAVDNSEKIVAFGAAKAKKNGLKNLEFRLGDLQDPPVEAGSVDIVILSQAKPRRGGARRRTPTQSTSTLSVSRQSHQWSPQATETLDARSFAGGCVAASGSASRARCGDLGSEQLFGVDSICA